jgi:AraC-like DNA-binding protein
LVVQRSYCVEKDPTPGKVQRWNSVVSAEVIRVCALPADPARFSGKLTTWSLGNDVALMHQATDAIAYVRLNQHVKADREAQILVTFSCGSDLTFVQDRMSLTCGKNQFFIELVNRPYRYTQVDAGDVWMLRMNDSLLRWHVRSIEKYAPYTFDASRGIGALLFDTLRMLPRRLSEAQNFARHALGRTVVELLALALESNEHVLGSQMNSVKAAHLARIERFIRANLSDCNLTPELIAAECNISTSYVHQLFRSSGTSVARWIRELRLIAADHDLRDPSRREGVAEIAYRWGFRDHAQFCRQFKGHFGRTPSDSRELAPSSSASALHFQS